MIESAAGALRTRIPSLRTPDFKWSVLAAMLVIDIVWVLAKGWTIRLESTFGTLFLAAVFLLPLLITRYRNDQVIRTLCGAVIYSLLIAKAAVVLSYLVVTTSFPLVDHSLARFDALTGFDWIGYFRWTVSHGVYYRTIHAAYFSLAAQTWAVIMYLCLTKRTARVAEFLELSAALIVVSIAFSLFFPAEGAARFYFAQAHADVSAWSHFEALRSDSLHAIDLNSMQELISIPSVHTVMAILFCRAARRTPLVVFLIPLNILLLLSTPVVGGHHVVDVLAGGALTFVAIGVRQKMIQGEIRKPREQRNFGSASTGSRAATDAIHPRFAIRPALFALCEINGAKCRLSTASPGKHRPIEPAPAVPTAPGGRIGFETTRYSAN